MSLSKDRIACLDGLRALSILFVVLGHLAGTRGFPFHENVRASSLALLGVRVFFVISGFLITSILVGELRETRSMRLDRFYFRRTLRIFVPYYAFLTVVVILDRTGVTVVPSGDLISASAYATDYNRHAAWPIAHTWSLSVEEQFYLLWPAVLALLGTRRAFAAAAAVVVAVPLIRACEWQLMPGLHEGIGHRFETCADALATGCLLAGARNWLHARPTYAAALRSPPALLLAGAVVIGSIVLDGHPRAAFVLGWPVQNLGVAFVVDYCLRHPAMGFSGFLSTRPLVAVGRMSYSIYLWQQLFLDRESVAARCAFPLNLAGVALCATLSYYAVELGTVRLRELLEPRIFRSGFVAPVVTESSSPG
ncbi:MAG: acyltransferase family protein [bacterium]|nr:acyltransferase family protein [bacterium]